ncbi:hypothetical protein THAR02_00530 [Trichoderma harzianum]|uniref:Uncharacterized protein n=1 Tax=Trichoderma harzianum TaxID=5544 RepID=A0A0F9Y5M2_TRIHA|nr:hypothetical protein THAR02_00530 [Trichoderma harzianum]
MTILREHNRSRSLETQRSDFLHDLTNTTEGIHFPSTKLLSGKAKEKEALAVLCPEKAYKATDIAIVHLSKLLVQCNKWLPIFDVQGPRTYWTVVATTTSQMQNIELSEKMAKDVVFALLRARQRWILRQDNPKAATTTVRSHFIAGLQRLLQRFEEKEKDATAFQFNQDKDWKLTEKEIRDAKSRLMGPGSQMAGGRIGLSFHSPHGLYPIAQLSSAPMLERNLLGMLDSCVEKITPAEAVQALLSNRAMDAVRVEGWQRSWFTDLESSNDDNEQGAGVGHIIPPEKGDEDGWLYEKPQPESVPVPAVTMKRFFSEEPEDDGPAKKQVFGKGKARSVSTPVASQPPLTAGKSAKTSRSTSLQVPQTSKK